MGAGQTTKAISRSVTLASDHDASNIGSKSHESDATFAMALWIGTWNGSALGTDAAPNSTPPDPSRILRIVPRREILAAMGGSVSGQQGPLIRAIATGGSGNIVVQGWIYDDTQAKWIKWGGANTLTLTNNVQNLGSIVHGLILGAQFFLQITSNPGGVPAVGIDIF
jgi:hypothetical protein